MFITPQVARIDSTGVHSPRLLAKWRIIGIVMFIFGGIIFGELAYNLVVQAPLLVWNKALATTWPAVGLKNAATLKPIMDSGYYLGSWGSLLSVSSLVFTSSLSDTGTSWRGWPSVWPENHCSSISFH